jgi:threonine/homoserine/homoserine lactone efflux protein
MAENKPVSPPQISPYVFPVLLAGFGLWCFYDGWISTAPEMLKHVTFNRIASGVLLLWAGLDFLRTRRQEKAEQAEKNSEHPAS